MMAICRSLNGARPCPAGTADVPGPAARPEDALRVLHVVSSDSFAGIERHVLNLIRELRTLGCLAELACPPTAIRLREEALAAGIPSRPSATCRPRTWLATLARDVADDPPGVLHVHDGRAAVAGALLSLLAPGRLVRTQHFTHPASVERSGLRGRASLGMHRLLNRRLDGYTAVSRIVAEGARERRETGHAQVVVIPPAIELPSRDAVESARMERAQIAYPVVAFAGRLEAERQLDVLLRAIPLVLTKLPRSHFVLAGSGAVEGQLRLLAAQLGIEQNITWTGWVPDTYAVLSRAHIYVNTWPREGFGMATAEAMALGLPVVAINAGASAEIVDPGVTGFLVSEGDSDALAAAIVRVLADDELASTMGHAAHLRAMSAYGAKRTAQDTLAFYRRLSETLGS
ncbi:MAG: hypothetical protein QOG15_723 [Solirubrobacteraceae bacterium]|jgi:glycosyltransferase involved in cell wall biosynthesis|nr:hypothetical protein [Solirubrobacteraceae bacterium]